MKTYKLYISCLLILGNLMGCKKFVEVDPPSSLLLTKTVFQSDVTTNSALTGLYSQMVEQNFTPFSMALYTGLSADELNTNFDILKPVYQNGLQAIDAATNPVWTNAYNFIYQANALYEGCQGSSSLSAGVKKQVMAEALFIRAFWHFYLVNLYGDVPLITSANYTMNQNAARTSKAQVYQQIIADLKMAQADLNSGYVNAGSVSVTTDRVRPNKAVATAFLARVYLYMGNYVDAETQASTVINDQNYSTSAVVVNDVFLKNSKEAIWQLPKPAPTDGINTYEGYYFILTSPPLTNIQSSTTISPRLLDAFEDGDLRKVNWIGKFTDVSGELSTDYYFPNKYKVYNDANITEYSMVLRLAEQYLIRAESRAQLGNLAGAIGDVDVIRKRAGLSLIANTDPNISKTNLLTIILKERQTELFTEWGHRWLDLKRTGTIDAVMNAAASSKGSTWNTNRQLWPIPQKEISTDNNLKQNPGYN